MIVEIIQKYLAPVIKRVEALEKQYLEIKKRLDALEEVKSCEYPYI